jgi:hypothetical protein
VHCILQITPREPCVVCVVTTCLALAPSSPPQVLEDERKAEEAKGGTETSLVLTNDGTGVQDIGLLTELLEVIDSSLPLIGKTNAAKLAFAPDHESILLIRTSDDGLVRRERRVI